MEIKDLRIGNIVWHKSDDPNYRYSEVLSVLMSIRGNFVTVYDVSVTNGKRERKEFFCLVENLEGFPLTQKILRNNGVKSNVCNNIEKELYDSRKVFKYVHEFQNFLNLIGLDDELKIE